MSYLILYAVLAILLATSLRSFLGWLKNGGEFKPVKFARTVLIGFIAALMILGSKITGQDPVQLFFSVLTLTYTVDDLKKTSDKPKIALRRRVKSTK